MVRGARAKALGSLGCVLATLGAPGCSQGEPAPAVDAAAAEDVEAGPPPSNGAACARDEDCATSGSLLVCDRASGECVTPCTIARAPCDPRLHCDELTRTCVPGCSRDEACLPAADAGGRPGRCDLRAHVCVECLESVDCADGMLCAGGRCSAGCSGAHPCPLGEQCCGGACVDTRTNAAHCGACGTACGAANGTASCIDGACALTACAAGFADCDRDPSNGCEIRTTADPEHCGACGAACGAVAHGEGGCAAGVCRIATCYGTFRDCDGKLETGCEANVATDMANCGTCHVPCSPSTNACKGGECAASSCPTGMRDCDDDPSGTCETDIRTSTTSCGGCGLACVVAHGTARCAAASCALDICAGSFSNCDGDATNGCEVDLSSDPRHCGACGHACTGETCSAALVATMDTFPVGWTFNGSAFYDVTTGSAVLTAAEGETSTLVYATPIAIDSFELAFDFRIGGGGGTGADGLGFILETNGSNAVGGSARGIGMAGLTGFGIEFDTFPDLSNIGPCEPQTEHVGIDDLANLATSDVYCQKLPNARDTNGSLPLILRNSGWHTAYVHWSGATVGLSIDGAVVVSSYTLSGFVPGTSYFVGFSAASGILRDRHEVRNVRFDFPNVRCL